MPPVRHNPSQRVHDRVKFADAALQPTAEASSPSGGGTRNTSQKQHFSPVWNGQQVTPTAHYLLSNGVDSSLLHGFSPVLIHSSSHILDPSSSLPLPPKPNVSGTQDKIPTQLTYLAVGAPPDPSASSSSPPSATPSLTLGPPTSKLCTHPPAFLPAATDTQLTVCTYQPPAQPARPSNNFVLFRVDYFARVNSLHLSRTHYASLPKVNGIWNQAPAAVKSYYSELARLVKEVHGRLHPGYKFKPRTKDKKQRQQDEKARFKRQTAAKARASRTTKVRTKSSTTPDVNTTPPPTPKASVDVRMYDPARRTYYRPHSSNAQSLHLPLAVGAPPTSPSPASSPSSARSSVRNGAQLESAYHLPSSSSHQTTSPAYTLFQVEETESPQFQDPYCTRDDGSDDNNPETVTLWPTIEDDVDWYQVAPPHWCGPDDGISFCDDENACNTCMSMRWSDELNIEIPTASTTPIKYTGSGYSFALNPTSYMPSLFTLSSKTLSFANDSLGALLASTMEAYDDRQPKGFWNGFFAPSKTEALYNPPPPPSINYPTPPRDTPATHRPILLAFPRILLRSFYPCLTQRAFSGIKCMAAVLLKSISTMCQN